MEDLIKQIEALKVPRTTNYNKGVNDTTNEVLEILRSKTVIKAKALRKLGTERWFYHYNMEAGYFLSTGIEAFSSGDFNDIPEDAELIDIEIIIP